MTPREFHVRLADGRVLQALDAGAAGDRRVVLFHGTPGSRLVPKSWLGALMTAGIRLLAWDRPGYGGSARLAHTTGVRSLMASPSASVRCWVRGVPDPADAHAQTVTGGQPRDSHAGEVAGHQDHLTPPTGAL
jgi:hypothetical protein